jgi:hypothetical protein
MRSARLASKWASILHGQVRSRVSNFGRDQARGGSIDRTGPDRNLGWWRAACCCLRWLGRPGLSAEEARAVRQEVAGRHTLVSAGGERAKLAAAEVDGGLGTFGVEDPVLVVGRFFVVHGEHLADEQVVVAGAVHGGEPALVGEVGVSEDGGGSVAAGLAGQVERGKLVDVASAGGAEGADEVGSPVGQEVEGKGAGC